MWRSATLVLFPVVLLSWYLRNNGVEDVPKLSEIYWGPGKPVPDSKEIRPFQINVPEQLIEDLNKRLDNTREMVPPLEDSKLTYGFSSTLLKTVVNYWRHNYKWTERQKLLNKYPQFMTTIQGLDIHFYHVKPTIPSGRDVKVLPMLILHGWPGSIVEFQKLIPLLTTPKEDRNFVFELVVPSLPGYGFSKPAVRPGLGPAQIAVVLKNLMLKLGHTKFYTQGGDWGSAITTLIGMLFPQNVIGVHLNFCFSLSPMSLLHVAIGNYLPSLVVEPQYADRMYPLSKTLSGMLEETGYMHIQATKPDTVGTGLSDSPAGLAAYILEKFSTATNPANKFTEDGNLLEKFTMDELIDNLMIYWVTNSITTSQRLYAEYFSKPYRDSGFEKLTLRVPTACALFPHEIIYQPEAILAHRYTNLIQVTHPPRGGHFAALEEPDLMTSDVWSFVHKSQQLIHNEEMERAEKAKKKASEKSTN